ncbi:zinc dependent phospholipase C family protein [Vallitalea pronyensis]|uniref:Zinc dependent phospholipase C family protein n=1 Tax=Vallitalea pronyensis TaxID=1348613 RepID=A0A8J8MM29_9FIRM|nr:zinc dependent phospholipase C family protein [Vallitalea pronyensis]QUI23902.1 zinc dependent phospholipase C family protein [Vallitalea pronyensis]
MATWGIHIRIAEKLLDKYGDLDEVSFLVGNIGPDCGKPNEDWSSFTPSKEVSHWMDENRTFRADLFYSEYLDSPLSDKKERSFLLGYYVHLLTDRAWRNMINDKKETHEAYAPLIEDKSFIWTIKKDWYDLDFKYFRDHPDCIFFRTFQHITSFPNYLDYYPEDAIINQVRYITAFYTSPHDNLDRDYKYLTMDEMNIFIDNTIDMIVRKLN